jgi:NADH-quinone oxidoreductase subunit C
MTPRLQKLFDLLQQAGLAPEERLGELTLEAPAAQYMAICLKLRDSAELRFDQAIDLCGVDYSAYSGRHLPQGGRFAVVVHLQSITHNRRLRVRCLCPDAEFPMLPSLCEVWPSINWYEREAFDLFGIMFDGHPDLRRILTDYGFVGHPFRKDFPVSGYVEMRYDPEQKRVVYQPVTIEPREIVPRVTREDVYGESGKK